MESDGYLNYCFCLRNLSATGWMNFQLLISCLLFTLDLFFLDILAFPLAIYFLPFSKKFYTRGVSAFHILQVGPA